MHIVALWFTSAKAMLLLVAAGGKVPLNRSPKLKMLRRVPRTGFTDRIAALLAGDQ